MKKRLPLIILPLAIIIIFLLWPRDKVIQQATSPVSPAEPIVHKRIIFTSSSGEISEKALIQSPSYMGDSDDSPPPPKCLQLPKLQASKVKLFHQLVEGVPHLPIDTDIDQYLSMDEESKDNEVMSEAMKFHSALKDYHNRNVLEAIRKLEEIKDRNNGAYSLYLADIKASYYMNELKGKDDKILEEVKYDVLRGLRKPIFDTQELPMKTRIYELGMLSPEKYEIAQMIGHHIRMDQLNDWIFEIASVDKYLIKAEILAFAKRSVDQSTKLQDKPEGFYWSSNQHDTMVRLYNKYWYEIHTEEKKDPFDHSSSKISALSINLPGHKKQRGLSYPIDICADLEVYKKQWEARKAFFKE